MKKLLASTLLLMAATTAYTQTPSVGQFVVAIEKVASANDAKTPGVTWTLNVGEVYKFQGYDSTGLMILIQGKASIKSEGKHFAPVPPADVAKAAMKYAEDVKTTEATMDEDRDERAVAMHGDWPERSGVWRGPDGGVISSSQIPKTKGPFRIHRRAVDGVIEAMICRRDTAIANADKTEAQADGEFNTWLTNKRQAEQLAEITEKLNQINRNR